MYLPRTAESEDEAIPVIRLTYNPATGTHEAYVSTPKFIKGPVPLDWISRANALPGKAGAVGIALWFLVGVQKSRKVKLSGEVERIAGCARKAVYSALSALERNKLLSVQRNPGMRPVVMLNDCKERE
jgi:hypothetical protein